MSVCMCVACVSVIVDLYCDTQDGKASKELSNVKPLALQEQRSAGFAMSRQLLFHSILVATPTLDKSKDAES